MPELTIENHLPHHTNTIGSPEFPAREWPEREHSPRAAEETVAILGLVQVAGIGMSILQRRFTRLVQAEGIPYNPDVLKIVSYETIAAARRSDRPIDDLAYPWGIVRASDGSVLGCRGFGMPVPVEPVGVAELAISPQDVAALGPPETWVNTTNFPFKLYDPRVVSPDSDLIDPQTPPILTRPPADTPVDVTPLAYMDETKTEQFGVPIMRVQPNPSAAGITNLPAGRESLHIIHPIAFRHAVLLGQSVRLCGIMGGLVRDRERGTVLGSTAIYVPDPDMIAQDGM